MRFSGMVAFGFAAACATAAPASRPTSRIAAVPEIRYLFPTAGTVVVGDSILLEAVVCSESHCMSDPTLTAEASTPEIVRITRSGFVHALAPGPASITLASAATDSVTISFAVMPRFHRFVVHPATVDAVLGDTIRFTAQGVDSSGGVITVVPALFTFTRGLERIEKSSDTIVLRAAKTGRFEVTARIFQREATAAIRVRRRPD